MNRSYPQLTPEGQPVHPRIVRYVVGALLIGSLVRVCMGSTEMDGVGEPEWIQFNRPYSGADQVDQ